MELLIAILILSLVMIDLIYLHWGAMGETRKMYWRSIAFSQLIAMKESENADDDILTECSTLLPKGECRIDKEGLSVCWQEECLNM